MKTHTSAYRPTHVRANPLDTHPTHDQAVCWCDGCKRLRNPEPWTDIRQEAPKKQALTRCHTGGITVAP